MMLNTKNQVAGFTLIELIMTLAVGGIVMSIAVPSYTTFTKNNQLTTQVNDMVSTVNLARTEAIKRKDRITICKSTDGATCAASSYSWLSGWIAFVDSDGDSVVDSGEDLISVKTAMPAGATTDANLTLTANGLSGVSFFFTANGRSSIADGQAGEILICDSRADITKGKLIYIHPIGRVETISGPTSGTASTDDTTLNCT